MYDIFPSNLFKNKIGMYQKFNNDLPRLIGLRVFSVFFSTSLFFKIMSMNYFNNQK